MLQCVFFNDTATTEIYTLSLHDALPILIARLDLLKARIRDQITQPAAQSVTPDQIDAYVRAHPRMEREDRKSTRLNSSHANISYAVFCLKKKHMIHCSHGLY